MALIRNSFIFLTSFSCLIIAGHAADTDAEEYCNSETFRPSCTPDEVIVIEEATFGRKKLGRCLESEGSELSQSNMADRKFIGCYANVMPILEPLCSLKKQCEVRVAEITAEVPCYKYLKCSLEIRYSCVRVIQENRSCNIKLGVHVQNLLVSKASSSNCGIQSQPWTIEALPGQRISMKALTFPHINSNSNKNKNNNNSISTKTSIVFSSASPAISVGYIIDKFSRKKTSLLSELNEEDKETQNYHYTSESNTVEMYFQDKLKTDQISFLLSIEATGCSDLIPPADAWLKRTENEATIGCYSTRLRWQLKCQGQRWVGVIGNCSQGQHLILRPDGVDKRLESKSNNQTVAIFLIVVSGLVLCMLITCTGIVFLKRYYAVSRSKALKQMSMNGKTDHGMSFENGGSVFGTTNAGKTFYGSGGKGFPQTGEVYGDKNDFHFKDNCQYFELDGSLVDKESNFNVVQ